MADVATTLKDPNFLGLPLEERRKVLVKLDPNFGSLPGPEQDKVLGVTHTQSYDSSQRGAKLKGEPQPLGDSYIDTLLKGVVNTVGTGVNNITALEMARHGHPGPLLESIKGTAEGLWNLPGDVLSDVGAGKWGKLAAEATPLAIGGMGAIPNVERSPIYFGPPRVPTLMDVMGAMRGGTIPAVVRGIRLSGLRFQNPFVPNPSPYMDTAPFYEGTKFAPDFELPAEPPFQPTEQQAAVIKATQGLRNPSQAVRREMSTPPETGGGEPPPVSRTLPSGRRIPTVEEQQAKAATPQVPPPPYMGELSIGPAPEAAPPRPPRPAPPWQTTPFAPVDVSAAPPPLVKTGPGTPPTYLQEPTRGIRPMPGAKPPAPAPTQPPAAQPPPPAAQTVPPITAQPGGTVSVTVPPDLHPDYVKYVEKWGVNRAKASFAKDDAIGKFLAETKNMAGEDWIKAPIEEKDAVIRQVNKALGTKYKLISGKGGSESRSAAETISDIARRVDFHWNKPQIRPVQ